MLEPGNPHRPGRSEHLEPGDVPRVQQGTRIRTKTGETGRVQRLDPDNSIAYVQIDDELTPRDGTPIAVEDLELLPPE
jgi:hypothetical protein